MNLVHGVPCNQFHQAKVAASQCDAVHSGEHSLVTALMKTAPDRMVGTECPRAAIIMLSFPVAKQVYWRLRDYPVFNHSGSKEASLPSRCTTFLVPGYLAVLTVLRRCCNTGIDCGFVPRGPPWARTGCKNLRVMDVQFGHVRSTSATNTFRRL